MPKNNYFIAEIFYKIADILDSMEVEWKPQAYRKAARNLELLDIDVWYIYKTEGHKGIENIKGIGKALAKKIIEYLKTEKIEKYEELKKDAPFDIEGLSSISTIGPKKALKLYKELGVKSIPDLKEVAKHGKIRKLPGFGIKSENDILESLKLKDVKRKDRVPLDFAKEEAEKLRNNLKAVADKIEIAGSIRRKKDTIGDIDLLATSENPKRVIERFSNFKDVRKVLAKGNTKAMIILDSGLQVDLRVVKKDNFGAALLYFSGPREHNIWLRRKAIKKGYKLNEYGLFNRKNGERVASKTEKEIYKELDLDYIEPEKREKFS